MKGRVLIIAGSDCSGGAGLQADLKTVTAMKAYGATAVTALTAQNTLGVFGVHPVPVDFIRQQIRVTLEDIGADCVKTGMLHTSEVIEAVAETLRDAAPGVPLVADPVMVAKGGAPLLEPGAVDTLRRLLIPAAFVLTPNLPEAEALLGRGIRGLDEMKRAAAELLSMGAEFVVLKGGRGEGGTVWNVLAGPDALRVVEQPRLETKNVHGAGDSLASAIAAGIARGMSVMDAAVRALDYVHAAIRHAPGLGGGNGPLNHAAGL